MKKLLPFLACLWAASASAQFVPGQVLTAAELNTQFALYAPLAGATFTGGVSGTTFSGTFSGPLNGSVGAVTPSTGSFTNLTATGTLTFPSGSLPFSYLPNLSANSVAANFTGAPNAVASYPVPSCNASTSAVGYASGSGFTCNTSINAATLGGATFASPGPVGSTTASTGAFTTLSASSTVSGTGFTNRFASPGPIGNTAASTGAFTTLSSTGTFTPSSTNGIVGTTTNDSANAGSIGEYQAASVMSASPTSISSGTAINLVSLTLSAGDWDVEGSAGLIPAGTTVITAFQGSISAASLTPQDTVIGGRFKHTYTATTGQGVEGGTIPVRINLATPTTIYFVVIGNFTTSTCTAYGIMRARRVR